jgi:hypothetical protein
MSALLAVPASSVAVAHSPAQSNVVYLLDSLVKKNSLQCEIGHILRRRDFLYCGSSRLGLGWNQFPRHDTTEITKMKAFVCAALLTGFGAIALAGSLASSVPASAKCMVDEGNGRYTPCSALYTSKKCMVDEGNGRYTPCSALVKQQKKTAKQ